MRHAVQILLIASLLFGACALASGANNEIQSRVKSEDISLVHTVTYSNTDLWMERFFPEYLARKEPPAYWFTAFNGGLWTVPVERKVLTQLAHKDVQNQAFFNSENSVIFVASPDPESVWWERNARNLLKWKTWQLKPTNRSRPNRFSPETQALLKARGVPTASGFYEDYDIVGYVLGPRKLVVVNPSMIRESLLLIPSQKSPTGHELSIYHADKLGRTPGGDQDSETRANLKCLNSLLLKAFR
jgi:hypothetical protein